MGRQRLAAESSSAKPPGEKKERGIVLLRPNATSLSIAFVLSLAAGMGAYLMNVALGVPELLFVLVVCYVLVHVGRWVWARSQHPRSAHRARPGTETHSEEPSQGEPADRGPKLLELNRKSLALAFILTVLAGVYAYLKDLELQAQELLFVLVACYAFVHAGRWLWARINGK